MKLRKMRKHLPIHHLRRKRRPYQSPEIKKHTAKETILLSGAAVGSSTASFAVV